MISGRRGDCALALALFAVAVVVGSAYVRAFDRMGSRTPPNLKTMPSRSMWYGQSDFGSAVALACGRGYVDPGLDSPALVRFLSLQSDSFSCDELPATLPPRPLRITQRLYPYLLSVTAAIWAVRGVSWTALWPLFGVLYGMTVAACYGLFRLGMGRTLSTAATVAIMISPVQLGNLPGLRDYAKAPFILALILIAAVLVNRVDRPRPALTLSALFGATLGIGFGFRNDLLIVIPLIVVALFGWIPPRTARATLLRLGAVAVAVLTFLIAALPILSGYTRGSNSGHVALLGFVTPFDEPLGIAPSVYEWSRLYSDGYTDAMVESYSNRVRHRQVEYLSAEYDRAAVEYLVRIAQLWPADILTRAYASVLRVVDMPFRPGTNADAVPYGVRSAWLQQFYRWHNATVSILRGSGFIVVGLALLVVSRNSVWWALLLLGDVLYIAGYPAIQFQPRHFFHLEFIAWWALGFLIERTVSAYPFRRNVPSAAIARAEAVRVVAFAAIAIAVIALPLALARIYQQGSMRRFLGAYADAPRATLPVDPVSTGTRTLLRTSTLWNDRDVALTVNTEYVVARVSPAACPVVRLPITFRYAAVPGEPDFSFDTVVTFLPPSPVDLFFPAYDVAGKSRFTGVEVATGFEKCVERIDRVRELERLPMLVNLQLAREWQSHPLYQRLADWELPDRTPYPTLYALPSSQTIPVRTVYSEPAPPALLWQTPMVKSEPASGWRIVGTPPTPVWPLFEFAAERRRLDDQFVIEGEVIRGGITVGLVHEHSWTADGNVTIAAPGRFVAVLAPSAAGDYGVLSENGLYGSWFLRHAPKGLVRAAAWAHDFNDVRISKAGWVRRENE